jgi:hypothetical protein
VVANIANTKLIREKRVNISAVGQVIHEAREDLSM